MDGEASAQKIDDSDYGSELESDEEVSLTELLQQAPAKHGTTLPLLLRDIEDHDGPKSSRRPRAQGRKRRGKRFIKSRHLPEMGPTERLPETIEGYRSVSAPVESQESRAERAKRGASAEPAYNLPLELERRPDLRSPLERFRTRSRKVLTVTDLISPSWCELQYWYVLTKHGKKRRTPAMKQGSAVHERLERQVHRTVEVKIKRAEDEWGSRIWNIIQGLRTLQETGITRELELWGMIDGQVVNGIVDELTYVCPDRELEEAIEKPKKDNLPEGQATIDGYLQQSGGKALEQGSSTRLSSVRTKTSRIYLTDVKTRGVKSVPKGASFRPTLMQLMLYHRLFSELATNKVDAAKIFARYKVDPDKPFSDAFIAQICNLHEIRDDASDDPAQAVMEDPPASTEDFVQVLLDHNSLAQLWQLMIQEFQRTMPDGAESIGKVLKAEYRGQQDGEILGSKTFLYDDGLLQNYIDDEMRWWRGEREARGVDIQEAYKCGYCEFADECTWRKTKIAEATDAHRNRSMGERTKSSV